MRRKKFAIYVDEETYKGFEEAIKETGFSVSRMIEFMMRANIGKHGKSFGEILDTIFNLGTKRKK